MLADRVVGTLFVVLGGALGVGVLLIERVGFESTASLRMLQVLAGVVAAVYMSLGVVVWRWTRRPVAASRPATGEGV